MPASSAIQAPSRNPARSSADAQDRGTETIRAGGPSTLRLVLSSAVFLAAGCAAAQAQVWNDFRVWTGPQEGLWSDAANWQDTRVPDSANIFVFMNGLAGDGSGFRDIGLGGGAFSAGVLYVGGNGARLGAGSLTLADDQRPMIIVASGGFSAGTDLDIILHDSTEITVASGLEAVIDGRLLGDGGIVIGAGTGTGTVTLTGANLYEGGTTVSGGTLIVSGAGTLGADTGTTSVGGGTLTVNTAVTQGSVNLSGGTIDGTGTLTTGGLARTGGSVDAGVTLDAARTVIAIGGTATAAAGGLAGTNTGAGTVTATTLAGGAVDNGAGAGISVSTAGVGNSGAVTVTTADSVTGSTDGILAEAGATGDVTVTAGGDVTGTAGRGIAAGSEDAALSVTVNAGATVTGATGIETNAAGGTATIDNSGTVRGDGAADDRAFAALGSGTTVFNNLDTGATFGMITSSALSGPVTVNNAGSWTLNAGGTSVMAGANDAFNNSGTLDASAGASLTGIATLANTGTINLGAGATLGAAAMTNAGGTINAPGTATLAGNLDNSNGTISLMNGAADSVLTVTGNLSGANSAVEMEVDLTLPDGGVADRIAVTGNATGSMNMTLTSVGGLAEQNVPVTLLSAADLAGLTVTATSATPGFEISGGGLFIYNVVPNMASNEIQLVRQLNPGAAGVAGNLTVVQSLIGSVINRPSSAFVGGLAADTDDNCSPGAWARLLGGSARGTAFTFNGVNNVPGTVRASYGGLQGGFDFGCFNAFEDGWDIVGGVTFGVTDGRTTQDIFALDGMGNPVGPPTSTNRAKFDQQFAGAYLAFARGDWFGDVRLRGERTRFSITNPALNLDNSSFRSRTSTVSASLSRSFAMDGGLTFVPTGGFAVNRSKGGTLTFADLPASTLLVDDHTGKIGFLGGTLVRTTIGEDGDSATNQFVTATVHNDFSKARTSTFNPGGGGAPIAMRTGNLGTFGELSVGLSYLKLIDPQSALPAKQFDASIRVDARYSRRIEGIGLTAQMRFQF